MADQGNITTPSAADLDAAARRYAAAQGWAMPDGSYPVRPADRHGRQDLQAAVHAVGRGGGSHNAIRAHLIKRAHAIGAGDLIPSNWGADGSISGQNSLEGTVEIERRYTSGDTGKAELRAFEGDRHTIGGYAAVFNRNSKNLGGFLENVDPIAFNQSRGDGWPEVICRYNHDDNQLLGTTAAATLRIGLDKYGLSYDVDPPRAMEHITELVQRGDVRKSSFAFRTIEDDWTTTEQGYPLRRLLAVQLVDVAPVNIPAYADTSAGLRSLADKFGADLTEVRSLAEQDELRKFFVRTDNRGRPKPAPKKGLFGPSAAIALLERKEDPYV